MTRPKTQHHAQHRHCPHHHTRATPQWLPPATVAARRVSLSLRVARRVSEREADPAAPTVDLTTLSIPQLSQLKKQLDSELEHLTSSFQSLRSAQSRFRDCLKSINTGLSSGSTGTRPTPPPPAPRHALSPRAYPSGARGRKHRNMLTRHICATQTSPFLSPSPPPST